MVVGGEKPVRGGACFIVSQMASQEQTETGLGSLSFLILHTPETTSPTHPKDGNMKTSISNTDGTPAFRS